MLPPYKKVEISFSLELTKPFLSFVGFLFAEGQINGLLIAILSRGERNNMFLHMTEIIARVCVSTGTQTLDYQSDGGVNSSLETDLEVFRVPFLRVRSFLQPLLKLWDCEEIMALLSLGNL